MCGRYRVSVFNYDPEDLENELAGDSGGRSIGYNHECGVEYRPTHRVGEIDRLVGAGASFRERRSQP